jgi:hypothetical protein
MDYIVINWTSFDPWETSHEIQFRTSSSTSESDFTEWKAASNGQKIDEALFNRYLQVRAVLSTSNESLSPIVGDLSLNINRLPVLSNGGVNPSSGLDTDEYVFSVSCKDLDDDNLTVNVYLNEKKYGLEEKDRTVDSLITYSRNLTLSSGEYEFYFQVFDGDTTVRLPETGAFSGLSIKTNAKPSANLEVLTKKHIVNKEIEFDASGSTDPDGSISEFKFDFGDNTSSEWVMGSKATHAYQEPGKYVVTLWVKDNDGAVSEPVSIELDIKKKSKPNNTGFIPGFESSILLMIIPIVIVMRRKF